MNYLRSFLQYECNWYRICKRDFYREYRCVSTSSPIFTTKSNPKKDCISCEIVVLKRNDEFVFSLALNGIHFGQYSTSKMKMKRQTVSADVTFFILKIGSISNIDLNFIPQYKFAAGPEKSRFIDPTLMYENCSLVSFEEIQRISAESEKKLFPLGACGSWCLVKDNTMCIYTFVAVYDLYLACCDKNVFPSLGKIIFDMLVCKKDECVFCKDHNKHVDQSGYIIGCISNQETCFCYTPCKQEKVFVNSPELLPLLSDEQITNLDLVHKKNSFSQDINKCVHGYNNDQPVVLKNSNWMLVKFSLELSRLIVLSCPVLKRLIFA